MLYSDECLQDASCRTALRTPIPHEQLVGYDCMYSLLGMLLHRRLITGIAPCSTLAKASLLQPYWAQGLAETHHQAFSITRGALRAS